MDYFDLTRKNSQRNPIKKIARIATSHFHGLAREIGSQPTEPCCEERDAIKTTVMMTVNMRMAAASTASNPATMDLK
jgi:hypothetical protein